MGGLSKRKTLFQQLNVKPDQALFLDAGALLFDKSSYPPGRNLDLAKINATGMVEVYNILGYEAVGVSRIDLAAGVNFLKQLEKKSNFTWISANLVDSKKRNDLFTPFIIKKKAGLRVGILGLTGSGAANEPQERESYLILPWQDLLPKIINKVSKEADLIILLSSLSPLENEQISQHFPQIHIIIQAGMYSHNQKPVLSDNTLICQAEKQGKYVGELHINWKKSGKWQDEMADATLIKRQELDRLTWQITRLESQGDPQIVYQNTPATLQAYYKLVERKKDVETEIIALQQSMPEKPESSTFHNTFLAITPNLADDPDVEQIIRNTREQVNALGRSRSKGGSLGDYVGSEACMKCHFEIGERWQQTRHAIAYETLVEKKQQFNVQCLPCHVTGVSILDKKQDVVLSLPDSLHNVGCETCHGPGMAHTVNPEEAKLTDAPDAYLCLQCHSTEHDNDFSFQRDKKLVH